MITFDSKRMRIAQGKGSYVWVNINAKNNYLPNHDDALSIRIEGAGWPRGNPVESLGPAWRQDTLVLPRVRRHPASGEYKLHIELLTARGELTASLPIDVVEPPKEPSQPKGGADEETGPDVRWISQADGDTWSESFGRQTVGRVDQDDESTIIWVNRDYDLLSKALSSSSLTAEQIETRADRYQFPVACGLWLQHHETSKMETPPEDDYLKGELHRLAEAVLVAMDPDVELASENGDGS